LSISVALAELSQKTGIGLAFSPDFFGKNPSKISLFFRNEKMSGVLEAILYDTNVDFRLVENQIVLFRKIIELPQNVVVSGILTDADSGERLIGASIIDLDRKIGVTTNEYGFFSLQFPTGQTRVRVAFLGFEVQNLNLNLTKSERVRIALKPSGELPEITVFSKNDTLQISQLPSNLDPELPLNASKTLPNLGGEADLGRLAMLLPGVTTGADGLGGLHVRGGDADHTQVLFDDVPVYYGTHALGMFTIFNPDVVRSARLWKGDLPARFGGRLGSVLDVRTKEGNLVHPETEVNLGLLAARFSVQTPIIKHKMGLLITGRHSVFGPQLKRVSKKEKGLKGRDGQTNYLFLDGNVKLNFEPSPRDRFYLSGYQGQDELADDESEETILAGMKPGKVVRELTYSWRNNFVSARWNHIWGERAFSNTTLTTSRFQYKNNFYFNATVDPKPDSTLILQYQTLNYTSQVADNSLRFDLDLFPKTDVHWKIGGSASIRGFVPGVGRREEYVVLDTALQVFLLRPDTLRDLETGIYFENDWQPNRNFSLNSGARMSFLRTKTRFSPNFEPRMAARWWVFPSFSIKTSAAFTTQYLHVLRGWDVGTPADLWIPVTKKTGPQHGFQTEFGMEKNFRNGISVSVVGFFKKNWGLREWKNSVLILGDRDALLGDNLDDKISRGTAKNRGIETLVSGKIGGLSGWISYAWSKSERQFDSLNYGRPFPFRYDRRHQFSAVFAQKLGDFTDLSVVFTFASGDAITNDTTQSVFGQPTFLDLNIAYKIQIEARNNLRLPNYQRLDAGLNFQLPARGKRENRLSVGVYNALNYTNARYQYRTPSGKKRSLPGLSPTPYLNFSFKM
jgi:prepilin-type processing-associated H-X9-DG protein